MDTIILVVISVSGTLVLGVFLRNLVAKINRRRNLEMKLRELARLIDLQPFKKDFFSDKLLVLDKVNRKLIYLDYFNSKHNEMIDLPDLKECRLLIRGMAVRLELRFNNPYRDAVYINFYQKFVDAEYSRSLLSAKARLWNQVITTAISQSREFEYGITG